MGRETLNCRQSHLAASMSGPWICASCALIGPTCCRCTSEEDTVVAPLSESEWRLIQAKAPWTAKLDFVAKGKNSSVFLAQMIRLFPTQEEEVLRAFPKDGFHYKLAMNKEGRCLLLGPKGCLLPYNVRPLFCRMYPFWMTTDQLQIFGYAGCLAIHEFETVPELCAAMQTGPSQLLHLFYQICLAWGVPPPRQCLSSCD
ncbi:MAG: hypothetical protein KAI75_08590 [Desulfobulbaceae bacterium]|nr:hypothetical protein [Desulfobulbaceae bacterium]